MKKIFSMSVIFLFLLTSRNIYAGAPPCSTLYLIKVEILHIQPLDATNIHKVSVYIEYPGRSKKSRGSAEELAQLHKGFVLEVDVLKRRDVDFTFMSLGRNETPINDTGWIPDNNNNAEFYFYPSESLKESLTFKEGDKKSFRIDQLLGCDTHPPIGKCIFENAFIDGVSGEYKTFIVNTLIHEVSEKHKKYLVEDLEIK